MKKYWTLIKSVILLFLLGLVFFVCYEDVRANADVIKLSEKLRTKVESNSLSNEHKNVILLIELEYYSNYDNERRQLVEERNKYINGVNSDVEDTQEFLLDYRQRISDISKANSYRVLTGFNFDYELLWVSECTPYIKIITKIDNISMLESNNYVKYIEILDPDAHIVTSSGDSNNAGLIDRLLYHYNPVYEESLPYMSTTGIDNVITNYNLDGTGINLAFLDVEGGVDDDNIELQTGVYVNETSTADHPTTVAIIAAGRVNGIAKNANIIAQGFSSLNQPLTEFEDLVMDYDYPANIINCSWEYLNDYGQYDDISRWIDNFVQNTLVSVVFAAGNVSYGNDYGVSRSATAKNVITVGSTSASGDKVSFFSRYETDDDLVKPLIVAPGGDFTVEYNWLYSIAHIYALEVPNSPLDEIDIIGTSFAAPQVSGAIALMMQYDSVLLLRPDVIASILACGSTNEYIDDIIVDSNDISNEAGSGLVDFVNVFQILENSNYITKTNSYIYNLYQYTIKSVKLSFVQNEEITVSSYFIGYIDGDVDLNNTDYDFYISGPTTSWQYHWHNISLDSNFEKIAFTVPETGYYYLYIVYRSKSSSNVDYISVSLYSNLDRNVIYSSSPGTC